MRVPTRFPLVLIAAIAAGSTLAQTVYRGIDASGRPIFSDQPQTQARPTGPQGVSGGPGSSAENSALPYELRQIAQRYPVTFYAARTAACAPCDSGRAYLIGRGIPFTERSVNTPEDTAALQNISGQNSLPLLTIGSQQLNGYSDLEWTKYLDAAGYPKKSQLPPGYSRPPATPLAAQQKAPETDAPPTTKVVPEVRSLPLPSNTPSPSNPAGIRF